MAQTPGPLEETSWPTRIAVSDIVALNSNLVLDSRSFGGAAGSCKKGNHNNRKSEMLFNGIGIYW